MNTRAESTGDSGTTLDVTINGEPAALASCSVAELLASRGIDATRSGVAVAINDRVVRRAEWPSTAIAAGDRLEIITAMQGG